MDIYQLAEALIGTLLLISSLIYLNEAKIRSVKSRNVLLFLIVIGILLISASFT